MSTELRGCPTISPSHATSISCFLIVICSCSITVLIVVMHMVVFYCVWGTCLSLWIITMISTKDVIAFRCDIQFWGFTSMFGRRYPSTAIQGVALQAAHFGSLWALWLFIANQIVLTIRLTAVLMVNTGRCTVGKLSVFERFCHSFFAFSNQVGLLTILLISARYASM